MEIVVIVGSPHGMKGNTGSLVAPLVAGAEAAGARVRTFLLGHMNVQPCRACDCCHRTGKCRVDDDFEMIRAAIAAADGVVLASPNYIFSASAQMKAFMDRCTGPLHLQAFEGKYGAAVVTSGGPETAGVEQYLLRFLGALGLWAVGSLGAEGRLLADAAARQGFIESAARLGGRMIEAIQRQETFSDQEPARTAFVDRMRTLVTMRQGDWVFEYQYWKSMGRL
jgi:multimeric flavodoxin WrbA